jgi:hypothetical protein
MTIGPAPRPWPGSLDWGESWLDDAATELAHLGFVLRDGGRTGTVPGPRLLIALRDAPTLEHFDPEEVTYWAARGGRCQLARLDVRTPMPLSREFAWGKVQVTDRIPVSNQFLSFGGTLIGDRRDAHEVIVAFVSRAPIVRWAGHSQGVDPFTDEIGAFFARLMVPVDYQPDAETRIAEAAPEALYAAFLEHARRRRRPGSRLRDADPALTRNVDHEARRLEADAPAAWRDGVALLDWLQLG